MSDDNEYDDDYEPPPFITEAQVNVSSEAPPDPVSSIFKERDGKFDTLLMHQFLEGKAKSKQVLKLYKSLERDPFLRATFNDYEMSREQLRELSAVRINRMARYIETDSPEDFHRRLNLLTVYDPLTGIRIAVNLGLYVNCVKGNGTDEQYKYWCVTNQTKDINKLYGCFGMTELGHGSNVAGCETTATFDEETDEFVIDTPNISATKWWIGGAAHSATHSAVYARLIVKGKDYGVKTFVVPLRDTDHELLPGVAIGDIGAKMGREGVDNGWIQFSDVRIPRFFMLQKFCKVSREGKVTLPPLEQLSYISLLGGRVGMAVDSYRIIARFITIAVRYGVGRRQFQKPLAEDWDPEVQIMDYALHQRRLFPILALSYAMALGTTQLENEHTAILKDLEAAVNANDTKAINKSIGDTKSLFIDSGSLKSTNTWLAADCITECRQSCGGHGYSSYNGFGKAYDDWVVQCTWEGDNSVLAMSVGKTLIKNVEDVLTKGKKVGGSVAFLSNAKEYVKDLKREYLTDKDVDSPSKILTALEVLIVRLCHSSLETLKSNGGDWDAISHTRVLLSKLRAHHYLLQTFIGQLPNADASIKPFLDVLLRLYANSWILDSFSAEFLLNYVYPQSVKKLVNATRIPELCTEVRPRAILLTDSFLQPDMLLNSAIGKYNGNIYENYFGIVKELNPAYPSKAPHSKILEDMLHRGSIDERLREELTDETKDLFKL